MLGIFISYRRADSAPSTGRLADALESAFGHDLVFRDVDRIAPGIKFEEEIERSIEASGVMLVVIGPSWLAQLDETSNRRLDNENDPVRIEIRTGLKRASVKTIPLLLDGAELPRPEELPDDIRALTGLQTFRLSDSRWRYDVARLVEEIERVPGMVPLVAPRLISRLEAQKQGPAELLHALSTITAALIIAGSIGMTVSGGPQILGLPFFGFIAFSFGVAFALFFLYIVASGLFHIQARWYGVLSVVLVLTVGTASALGTADISPLLISLALVAAGFGLVQLRRHVAHRRLASTQRGMTGPDRKSVV